MNEPHLISINKLMLLGKRRAAQFMTQQA